MSINLLLQSIHTAMERKNQTCVYTMQSQNNRMIIRSVYGKTIKIEITKL